MWGINKCMLFKFIYIYIFININRHVKILKEDKGKEMMIMSP